MSQRTGTGEAVDLSAVEAEPHLIAILDASVDWTHKMLRGRRSTVPGRSVGRRCSSGCVPPNLHRVLIQRMSRLPFQRLNCPTAQLPNRTPAQRLNGSTAQRNSGFSLLEMIVATTVLSLAIVGLLGVIRASLANAARVREYDHAAMRARSTMTELLATDPLPVPARLSGNYDDKSGWEARTAPAEMPITPRRGGVMVARVNLTVWWNSEGRRKTAVFDGFRRILIGQEHEGLLQ